MFLGECVKAVDCVSERASATDMFPGECCQAGCKDVPVSSCSPQSLSERLTTKRCDRGVDGFDENTLSVQLAKNPVSTSRATFDLLIAHFFARLGVEQQPSQFDDLC